MAHCSAQRWLPRLLWLVLLAIPLLLSASQPLVIGRSQAGQACGETYGPRAGERVTSWRTLAMQSSAAGLTDRQKLEKGKPVLQPDAFLSMTSSCGTRRIIGRRRWVLGLRAETVKTSAFPSILRCWSLAFRMKKCEWYMLRHWIITSFIWSLPIMRTPASVPLILDNIVGAIRPPRSVRIWCQFTVLTVVTCG